MKTKRKIIFRILVILLCLGILGLSTVLIINAVV